MGKRVKLNRGDIFRFELDVTRYGLGQIIEPGIVFYMTVLRLPVSRDFELATVDTRDILLCGRTTDAEFFHDRWHMIGNLPVPEDAIPRPCAKVEAGGKRWVKDFYGNRVRLATPYDWEHLDYESSFSPGMFYDAFKAHHGLMADKPHYAKLGYDHVMAQAAPCAD